MMDVEIFLIIPYNLFQTCIVRLNCLALFVCLTNKKKCKTYINNYKPTGSYPAYPNFIFK